MQGTQLIKKPKKFSAMPTKMTGRENPAFWSNGLSTKSVLNLPSHINKDATCRLPQFDMIHVDKASNV